MLISPDGRHAHFNRCMFTGHQHIPQINKQGWHVYGQKAIEHTLAPSGALYPMTPGAQQGNFISYSSAGLLGFGGVPGRLHSDNAVPGDQRGQVLLAPPLRARRPLWDDDVSAIPIFHASADRTYLPGLRSHLLRSMIIVCCRVLATHTH